MDARVLEFLHLLPEHVSFTVIGAPVWFDNALRGRSVSHGDPVLVLWGNHEHAANNRGGYEAIVQINGSMRANPPAEFTHRNEYAIVPDLADARWFIPLASREVAAAAFALYQPFKTSARLKHLAVRQLARFGGPGWYRDTIQIFSRKPSPLESIVRATLQLQHFHFAISAGTPGPERKPSIGVLDQRGAMHAIAKIGAPGITNALVQNEGEMLQDLNEHATIRKYVPHVLGLENTGINTVLLQSLIEGSPSFTRFDKSHKVFLQQLVTADTHTITQAEPYRFIRDHVQELPLEHSTFVASALNIATQLAGNTPLPVVINHGDFTPWNLRRQQNALVAFDWEYGTMHGLPLLDEIHFHVQSAFIFKNASVADVMALLSDDSNWSQWGYTPGLVKAFQCIYLAQIITQRSIAGHLSTNQDTQRFLQLLQLTVARARA